MNILNFYQNMKLIFFLLGERLRGMTLRGKHYRLEPMVHRNYRQDPDKQNNAFAMIRVTTVIAFETVVANICAT